MQENIKKKLYIILFFSSILMFFIFRDIYIKNETKKNGIDIVVKFTKKERKPKTTNFYFTYFINGKKYISANSGINYSILNSEEETEQINNLKINGFYLAKISKEYPNSIKVDPKEQVTVTIAILEAGFSKEDIKNMPK